MSREIRVRILHDLKRIAICIQQLIDDLDEVGEEVSGTFVNREELLCSKK